MQVGMIAYNIYLRSNTKISRSLKCNFALNLFGDLKQVQEIIGQIIFYKWQKLLLNIIKTLIL